MKLNIDRWLRLKRGTSKVKNEDSKVDRLSTYIINKRNDNYIFYTFYHKVLLRCFDKYVTGKLLDVGCGNKPYLKYLLPLTCEYVGCDIEQSSLKRVDIICSAKSISIESNTFDTVISTQVLEHIDEPAEMISECFRVLKNNGYFVMSTNLMWPVHGEPYDFYRFTKYGLIYLFEKTGFKVCECCACGGKWAMVGQMILLSLICKVDNTKSYLRRFPNKIVNRVLMLICNNLFPFLDEKNCDEHFTMNYVIVGKKDGVSCVNNNTSI